MAEFFKGLFAPRDTVKKRGHPTIQKAVVDTSGFSEPEKRTILGMRGALGVGPSADRPDVFQEGIDRILRVFGVRRAKRDTTKTEDF